MIETYQTLDLVKFLLYIILFYGLLKFILFALGDWVTRSKIRWQQVWLKRLQVLISPITMGFAIAYGLLTNPLWTLVALAVLYFALKKYVANYFLGIHTKINERIGKETNITVGRISGNINSFLTLGLWIHTNKGLHFITYEQLYNEGYTINDSNHISTSFSVVIKLEEDIDTQRVRDMVIGSPFLDSDQKIVFSQESDKLFIRINLRNRELYKDFLLYLQENGFTIIKN